ncbi:MAG: DUF6328 family protein [Myxococcota bacterium]|nr:DUF6328 family protein [Myxococcota bacterium]
MHEGYAMGATERPDETPEPEAERTDDLGGPYEAQGISQETERTFAEAQMVLPGVLTLFGFQIFAAINDRVQKELGTAELGCFVMNMCFLAMGAMFIILPAAYRRKAEPWVLSRHFVQLSSRMMSWSLRPLLLCFSVDTYVVTKITSHKTWVSLVVGALVLVAFVGGWQVFPWIAGHQRAGKGARHARKQTDEAEHRSRGAAAQT